MRYVEASGKKGAKKLFDIKAIRLRIEFDYPYLSSAAWSVKPIEVEGLGTYACDKYWRLYYDPALDWTLEEQLFVFIHELNHLIRRHSDRLPDVNNAEPWNIAADAEINDDPIFTDKLPKFTRPDGKQGGCVTPEAMGWPNHKLAEEYYSMIPSFEVSGFGPGAGQCGSAAGNPNPEEQGAPGDTNPKTGEENAAGMSDIEADSVRKQVAQAVQQQRQRGNIPAGLDRWAKDFLNPIVPWQRVLRSKVKRALSILSGATDYTWQRPNRRADEDDDFILPTPVAFKPRVSVVVDTSGSIGEDELKQFFAEIRSLISKHADSIQVVVCDAAVHEKRTIRSSGQVGRIRMKGGGGTDMRIGIEEAMRSRPRPNLVILLTDGYTPYPDIKPADHFIVALTTRGAEGSVPGYAQKVFIE